MPGERFDDRGAHALAVRTERHVRAAVGPPRRQRRRRAAAAARRSSHRRPPRSAPGANPAVRITDSRSMPDTTATCLPLLVIAAVLQLAASPPMNVWPCGLPPASSRVHDCSVISTRAFVIARMPGQHALAEREAELLDFAGCRARGRSGGRGSSASRPGASRPAALAERRREVPFEPERHRQLLRIVAVAAPHDAEHPQPRFAVAAGADSGHAANCTTCHVRRSGRRSRDVPGRRVDVIRSTLVLRSIGLPGHRRTSDVARRTSRDIICFP